MFDGGTTFNSLHRILLTWFGGSVLWPQAGRAVFWPATLDSDPFVSDDRTHHEALPVLKGTKYAANYWLHMYPFRTPSDAGCGNIAYEDNWY